MKQTGCSNSLNTGGCNPMRHKCDTVCFNDVYRPKIEVFHDLWPRRISMSDIDGHVEINGRFLFLEWKGYKGTLPNGQHRSYVNLTKLGGGGFCTVIVAVGDAQTMKVTHHKVYYNGKDRAWVIGDLDVLRQRMSKWCVWALRQNA